MQYNVGDIVQVYDPYPDRRFVLEIDDIICGAVSKTIGYYKAGAFRFDNEGRAINWGGGPRIEKILQKGVRDEN